MHKILKYFLGDPGTKHRNPIVTWECNNPKCDREYRGTFMGLSHLPDTDCSKCGWHDSMMEAD